MTLTRMIIPQGENAVNSALFGLQTMLTLVQCSRPSLFHRGTSLRS